MAEPGESARATRAPDGAAATSRPDKRPGRAVVPARDASPNLVARGDLTALGAQRTLWLAAIVDVALIAVGIASTYTYRFGGHDHALHLSVLAGALAAVAVVNFMSFFWFYRELRDAIAAAVVLTYIIMLSCMLNTNVQAAISSTALGRDMLTSLTTLTATIAGFYFAGRSYERAAEAKAAGSRT